MYQPITSDPTSVESTVRRGLNATIDFAAIKLRRLQELQRGHQRHQREAYLLFLLLHLHAFRVF